MSVFRPAGIVLGLLLTVGAVSVTGCGGDEKDARPQQTQPATTQPTTTPTVSAGAGGRGRADGNSNGTYTYSGSTKGAVKLPASADGQLALVKRARKSPRNRAAGCRLYALGKVRQWGPAPPKITARLQGDDVIVRWRFEQFPDSLGCRPFRVVIAVSKGRSGKPNFTSVLFKYRLHSLRGESRQSSLPYLNDPPYKVSVAGESVSEVQGPPVTVRGVDR